MSYSLICTRPGSIDRPMTETDVGAMASALWVVLAALAFWDKRPDAAMFLLLLAIWSVLITILTVLR